MFLFANVYYYNRKKITILPFLPYGYHHTPQFQTFTNLIIGIFRVRNPTFFFFWNYVPVIVNIIIWIFVSIKRLLQLIVYIGISPSPPQKHHPFFFAKPSLKTIQATLFRRFTPKHCFFFHSPPPTQKNRIFQWTPIILKFFIHNLNPIF